MSTLLSARLSTPPPRRCRVCCLQSANFFVSGDRPLGVNVSANVSCAAGRSTFVVPSDIATSLPVYVRIQVLNSTTWGRSLAFNLISAPPQGYAFSGCSADGSAATSIRLTSCTSGFAVQVHQFSNELVLLWKLPADHRRSPPSDVCSELLAMHRCWRRLAVWHRGVLGARHHKLCRSQG
jgi:hypothetical protein